MTEGTVTANAPEITTVRDLTQPAWHVELSFSDGWGCMQVASVNSKSDVEMPPELLDVGPNGEKHYGEPEKLDGWRVTLNKAGLADLIAKAQEIHDKMPD